MPLRGLLRELANDPQGAKLLSDGGEAFVSRSLRPYAIAALIDHQAERPSVVVAGDDSEAQALAADLSIWLAPRPVRFECGADRNEVFERLGHLQAVDVQVPTVQEIVDPLLALEQRLRLRNLVIVVREAEIDPARVDIDRAASDAAQHVAAHGSALDVPAGATLTPW